MSEENTVDILAIAPHPDDAEIFCGGLLIKMADSGYKTAIVDLTQGEMGSQGSVETREKEVAQASKILGLHTRVNLKLADGRLSKVATRNDSSAGLEKLVNTLRELRPKIVLAPYEKGRHPDHVAASKLSTDAVFMAALKNFDKQSSQAAHGVDQLVYYQLRYEFTPSFLVDISKQLERKMEAVSCFQSQISRDKELAKKDIKTLISSPLILEANKARDKYYGAMIGVEYAEAYRINNTLNIEDPINYFAKNPGRTSLFFPK